MYVCTIMHVFIMSTKSGLIKTLIVHAVFKMYIVEITRISAFHGYMTCSTFFLVFFVSDDFTLSPLGVPPVGWYAGFLKG